VILINLLPHREARRQQRKMAFFVGLGVAAALGVGVVLIWYTVVQTLIGEQARRNDFLANEIKRLDAQIADVASLKSDIEKLKARQKAVEDLQADRNMPVYLLNELVRQTPEGVYLTAVRQNGQQVSITGVAETNERISEFLRNAAGTNSQWLDKPILGSIKATSVTVGNAKDQRRMFEFAMGVTLKRPPAPDAAASGASAAARGQPASGGLAASAPAKR